MHVIIVFFNQVRTDYLVFGPYLTLTDVGDGITELANRYKQATSIQFTSLRKC